MLSFVGTVLVAVLVFTCVRGHRCVHDDTQHQQYLRATTHPEVVDVGFPPQLIATTVNQKRILPLHRRVAELEKNDENVVSTTTTTTPSPAGAANPPSPTVDSGSGGLIDNMRIVLDVSHLNTSGAFCASEGQRRPDYKGNTITCKKEDIVNSTVFNIITQKILPRAQKQLQAVLKVWRSTKSLQVPSDACGGAAYGFKVPQDHQAPQGVKDADLVVYVVSAPTDDGVLAWAGGCVKDTSGRNVVSRLNLAARYVQWEGTPDSAVDEEQVATATHELIHALGFTADTFKEHNMMTTATVRGKQATILNSTLVQKEASDYFTCPSIKGGELEDSGGSGSASSHWERRVLKEELMTAAGGTMLSAFTLYALEDLGVYTADLSAAQQLNWAKGAGCDFVHSSCTAASNKRFFCFDETEAPMCTSDTKAIGYCNVFEHEKELPSQFQYFSNPKKGGELFMDGCPIVLPFNNRRCAPSAVTPQVTTSDRVLGYYFGPTGRCFESDIIESGYRLTSNSSSAQYRCLQSKCDPQMGLSVAVNNTWLSCGMNGNGSTVTASGYNGKVTCPDPTSFCHAAFGVTLGQQQTTPTTDIPTAPPQPTTDIPTAPPVNTTTDIPTLPPRNDTTAAPPQSTAVPTTDAPIHVRGTLTFTGGEWRPVLTNSRALLELAIKRDVQGLLSLPAAENVVIQRLDVGSLVVGFGLTTSTETASAEEVEADFQKAIVDGTGWMGRIRSVYKQTASDDTQLQSADIVVPGRWKKQDVTWGYIFGVLLAIVMSVGLISGIIFVFKNKDKELEGLDETPKHSKSGSTGDGGGGGSTGTAKPEYEMGARTI